MANPANPLDRYVSYTYHFELHAGTSWDQLKYLEQSDANLSTDRFSANGTLLINTKGNNNRRNYRQNGNNNQVHKDAGSR
jgi:hypothetical protein